MARRSSINLPDTRNLAVGLLPHSIKRAERSPHDRHGRWRGMVGSTPHPPQKGRHRFTRFEKNHINPFSTQPSLAARRPPGPLWRDDHRVSARAPALRRVRVRAVLGRRRGARPAAEPTQGDATAGQDPRAGPGTLRDASSRATKAFYPALSLCDLIFSAVSERHLRLRLAIASSSWRGRPTCSRRWTTPTASATARRSTGSSTVCLWSLGAHFAIWARVLPAYSGAAEVV